MKGDITPYRDDSPVHIHKYFAFQIKKDFEPVIIEDDILYKLVEYVFSACNCGHSVKSVTKVI